MMIEFAGLQFHLYGLILGTAAVVGVLIGEKIVEKYSEYSTRYWQVVTAVFVGGILGARLYHVWTDWSIYAQDLPRVLMIWNGGLSIIGAVIGGCVAIILVTLATGRNVKKEFLFWTDLAVLCLPIAQAIGRLGNFVNQELYGQPSTLPWAIFIDNAHRVSGYEQFSTFHPLFAYEAIGMVLLAAVLWSLWQKKVWKIGDGNFLLAYLACYGIFRGALESLRLEKAVFMHTSLGLNQVIMIMVGVISLVLLGVSLRKQLKLRKSPLVVLLILFLGSFGVSGCQVQRALDVVQSENAQNSKNTQSTESVTDHSIQRLKMTYQNDVEPRFLSVEVVNTAKSIEQGLSGRASIGSDGMLFIFPVAAQQIFWMPSMQFDLDMIWVLNGKVVGVTENVPKPASATQPLSTLPKYPSPEKVNMVLEVPAGTAKMWQVRVGDALELL